MSELKEWENFYVIVGSAAGALIGLQFVVMTLIAERPPARAAEAGAAFATPTIVHFTVALLVSALVSAPWQSVTAFTVVCAAVGIGGVIYLWSVLRSMKVQTAYKPEFEDWLFHSLLPLVGYALFIVSAFIASAHLRAALFSFAAAALVLLLVGIHNAWDAVSYHVLVQKGSTKGET
jgi:hypothetical protein